MFSTTKQKLFSNAPLKRFSTELKGAAKFEKKGLGFFLSYSVPGLVP